MVSVPLLYIKKDFGYCVGGMLKNEIIEQCAQPINEDASR